jgi:isopentenyl-diphosphate Delta-isomerase
MDKLITIVDTDNNVIGSATRQDAQLKGLWHRIVAILIFNSKGQMYIQKRSPQADSSPNMWDHSAAGHVDSNETPEEAAKRELLEELGIRANNLLLVSTYKTQRNEGKRIFNRYWYIYKYEYEGQMRFQKEEVTTGKFVDIVWLKQALEKNPHDYTNGLRSSLNAYLEK